ncbi:MAG: hypothetical protein GY810_16280 [Aureispira sp.]|nr:hypothetical protein [Aureispira sp.]
MIKIRKKNNVTPQTTLGNVGEGDSIKNPQTNVLTPWQKALKIFGIQLGFVFMFYVLMYLIVLCHSPEQLMNPFDKEGAFGLIFIWVILTSGIPGGCAAIFFVIYNAFGLGEHKFWLLLILELRVCLKIKKCYLLKRFNKIWQLAHKIQASELFAVFS